MVLDWSALAPGPSGTAMLGESGIEGAARRGRERLRREEEQRALENKNEGRGDSAITSDAASDVTLVPGGQGNGLSSGYTSNRRTDEEMRAEAKL
ncbi:hypothetical protein PENANT_c035G11786 [Penicillium antarcticum]|uniref:Uncharacterized protein n=1 Tax=Penicillium antarcticum TaxID=416450 RepID=A0A1V6PTW3_9EURO|nr:hypothetical protein PENANT_c035G11786 [Penicillium antarcticum]